MGSRPNFVVKGDNTSHRLPRGFHDRTAADLATESFIRDAAFRRGGEIGCAPLRTSPVGFAAQFRRAAQTAGDKTYAFEDRKGRELMLTPDSTPAVMRHYLETGRGEPSRYAFHCDLFRYRRFRHRHFQQIGFAFVNEPASVRNGIDRHSLTLLQAGLRMFVHDMQISVRLLIQDFSVWARLFARAGLDEAQARHLMHELRPLAFEDRRKLLIQHVVDPGVCARAEALLQGGDAAGSDPWLEDTLADVREFGTMATAETGIGFELRMSSFHSSEVQEGVSFQLLDQYGRTFADGGCYSGYASRYDARLRSLHSFAFGIEHFLETGFVWHNAARLEHVLILDSGRDTILLDQLEAALRDQACAITRRGCAQWPRTREIERYRDAFDRIIWPASKPGWVALMECVPATRETLPVADLVARIRSFGMARAAS